MTSAHTPAFHLPPPSMPSAPTWQPRDASPGMRSFNELLDILQANRGIELYNSLVPLSIAANNSKDETFKAAVERLIRASMPLYDQNDRSPEHKSQVEFVHGLLLLLWGSREAVAKSNKARRERCRNPPTPEQTRIYLDGLQSAIPKMKFTLTLAIAAMRSPERASEIELLIADARNAIKT